MTAKAGALLYVSLEAEEDAQGFLDRIAQALAADKAAKGERYGNVYRRGYHAGADAAFAALVEFLRRGGRIGLPMGDRSIHLVDEAGRSLEVMSLLALRPFGLWENEA